MIAQAGGSPRGRQFASAHADTIVAHTKGVEAMKAYRDDVRARMVRHGRDPDDCKVLFMVAPILGETEAEAQEKKRMRQARAEATIPERLARKGWPGTAGAFGQGHHHRFWTFRYRRAVARGFDDQRASADLG